MSSMKNLYDSLDTFEKVLYDLNNVLDKVSESQDNVLRMHGALTGSEEKQEKEDNLYTDYDQDRASNFK